MRNIVTFRWNPLYIFQLVTQWMNADSVQLTKSMDALNGLFFLINNLSDLEPGGKLYKGTLPNYF